MENNARNLNSLAEDVREEGYNPESSMKDLVFDPVTGEFRQVARGSETGEGEIVTEMTNKGFAADGDAAEPVVYVSQEDVDAFLASGETLRHGYGHHWPGENVIHLGLRGFGEVKQGRDVSCLFLSSKAQLSDPRVMPEIPEDFDIVCAGGTVEVYMVVEKQDGERSVIERRPCTFTFIPSRGNLYSRSRGLLEVDVLKDRRVMIVGLGSFGSQIAVELAKAGVGTFSLVDFDRVELHNLSRHTATVGDLGRLKTDVIEDAILGKNPYAVVEKHPVDINSDLDFLHSEVEKADLVICATDNNTSRFNISAALVAKGRVGIFGRAITRAEGGDVFRYRPGGPCYCCLVGRGDLQEEEISDVASARRDGRIAAYVSPEDAEAMVQVGLSSDIEPICNMMVKLALVELSRGTESGITCLEREFTYDYYMWANRRERHYANWKPFPGAGAFPTVMRWYGARIEKEAGCPVCGEHVALETGDAIDASSLEGIQIDLS